MRVEPARLLVRGADGWLDINAPHHAPPGSSPPPGTVCETRDERGESLLRRDGAGGWHVQSALLWSLLDPLAPRAAADPLSATAQVRRVWERLSWWAGLPDAERQSVSGLLERCARGGGEIVAILDRLAASGNPLGAATLGAPPAPRPVVALPQEPAAVAAFCLDAQGLGLLYGSHFALRPQQAEMAAAVARALAAHQPLLVEAGTGTGKTLAYLIPALARIAAGRGRVVVSTYSRALQAQILANDVPRLTAGGEDLAARLLMGRAHYLCLRQRRSYLAREPVDARQAAALAALRLWLLATNEGLRDELVSHPLLMSELSGLFSGVQPCLPDCWEQPGCFVVRARRLAREAPFVVVNHALLLSDQAAGATLLGPFADCIVDEAHRLPQVMLEARTVRLDQHRLTDLEELVGAMRPGEQAPEVPALLAARLSASPDLAEAAHAADGFGRAANRCLLAYRQWWRQAGDLLAPGSQAPAGQRVRVAAKDVTFAPLAATTAALLDAVSAVGAPLAALERRLDGAAPLGGDIVDLLARCVQAGSLLDQLRQDVRFVTGDPSDRWVTWLEPGVAGSLRCLGATPLLAGPLLRELWQDAGLAPVATSATLAVGEDFAFMLGELGLAGRRPPARTLAVPSSFDWERQTLCLAVENLPGPDHADFPDAVAAVLAELRRQAPRQTLVLFTAYRLLQDVAARLQARDEAADLFAAGERGDLLVQTPQIGAAELRERFRRGRRAMLLGTSTFWEGVDFPGDSLEIVVVTKLPFLVPTDPWVQARCEHMRAAGDDPFRDFMLRDAVLRLRQGVGRLLRRDTDRGVVVLLDNRLIGRNYGATFLSALPAPVRWLAQAGDVAGAVRSFLEAT